MDTDISRTGRFKWLRVRHCITAHPVGDAFSPPGSYALERHVAKSLAGRNGPANRSERIPFVIAAPPRESVWFRLGCPSLSHRKGLQANGERPAAEREDGDPLFKRRRYPVHPQKRERLKILVPIGHTCSTNFLIFPAPPNLFGCR